MRSPAALNASSRFLPLDNRYFASSTLAPSSPLPNASPPNLIAIIEEYRATVCFTAPTAYRALLVAMDEGADLSSLRAAVSAGATPVYEAWMHKTASQSSARDPSMPADGSAVGVHDSRRYAGQ